MFKFVMSAVLAATLGGMSAVDEAKASPGTSEAVSMSSVDDHWEWVASNSDPATAQAIAAGYQNQGFLTSITVEGGMYHVFIWVGN
jgi:hypothetical protein